MTTEQWMDKHFGTEEEFCPLPTYSASRQFFLNTFGEALEEALADEASTYDALMNVEDGTRGWEIYFEDWKQRGILS